MTKKVEVDPEDQVVDEEVEDDVFEDLRETELEIREQEERLLTDKPW